MLSRIKDTDKEDDEAKRRNKYDVESRCGDWGLPVQKYPIAENSCFVQSNRETGT